MSDPGKLTRPSGDVDLRAQALAAKIGGVASVKLPGFGDREFDAVSDEYVCQTFHSRSATRRPRNFLGLDRRVQIRETLRAAQETARVALFEFTARAPHPEVVDFIERNARRIEVQAQIVNGDEWTSTGRP